MKKMICVLMVVFCGILFIGCGAPKLSDDYNEEDLKSVSEEIIGYLNDGKYEKIVDLGSDEFKDALPEDIVKQAYTELSSKLGMYESIDKFVFKEKDEYAIVAAIVKYSEGKAQITLTFNKEMQLSGIHMK